MKEIFARRRSAARRLMRERGLDALLVSRPSNRYYLSGFELHDPQCGESAGRLVICADGRDWLATDSRYEEAAARIWPRERLFIYGPDQAADLAGLLRGLGLMVGLEEDCVSVSFMRGLLDAPGHPQFISACGLVEKLRLVKGPEEIMALEKSFALNHRLLAGLAGRLREGQREDEAAWLVERFFRENGASELAFASIIAVGRNAALPHAVPGPTPIAWNSPVLADVGCRVDSYCSDQTRTFWFGDKKSEQFEKAYDLVERAQKTAIAMIRPGVACADVYAAARGVFAESGQERHFNHGLGHGVGLETHEGPSLSPRSRTILEKGMVVTVEPGLYYPQWGGVRLEVTVLLEESGCRVL